MCGIWFVDHLMCVLMWLCVMCEFVDVAVWVAVLMCVECVHIHIYIYIYAHTHTHTHTRPVRAYKYLQNV